MHSNTGVFLKVRLGFYTGEFALIGYLIISKDYYTSMQFSTPQLCQTVILSVYGKEFLHGQERLWYKLNKKCRVSFLFPSPVSPFFCQSFACCLAVSFLPLVSIFRYRLTLEGILDDEENTHWSCIRSQCSRPKQPASIHEIYFYRNCYSIRFILPPGISFDSYSKAIKVSTPRIKDIIGFAHTYQ